MTALELVQDTINYYKTHPRAVNDKDACEYKTKDGNMCAVGRFIDWDKVEDVRYINEEFGSISNLNISKYEELQDMLLFEVKEIDREVWEDLQDYHDYKLTSNPCPKTLRLIREYEYELIEKYSK